MLRMQAKKEITPYAAQVSADMRKEDRACATKGHKQQAHASLVRAGEGERDTETTEGS